MKQKQTSFKICCVCNLSTHIHKKNHDVSYFKFPNTPERKLVWIKRLRLNSTTLKTHSKVCNAHFPRHQIGRHRLKKKALPTDYTATVKRNDVNLESNKENGIPFEGRQIGYPGTSAQLQGFNNKRTTQSSGSEGQQSNDVGMCGSKILDVEALERRQRKGDDKHICKEQETGTPTHRYINIRPRQLFGEPQLLTSTHGAEYDTKIGSGIPSEGSSDGYPCTETKSASEGVCSIKNNRIPSTPGNLLSKASRLAHVVTNQKKRLKRLQQKTTRFEEAFILMKHMDACRRESPLYFQWLKKQFLRFGRKGTPKYDLQERALALTFYYSCGENGYRTHQKMGFKLPSCSQIRRWLQAVDFQAGLNEDVLNLLQAYCNELESSNRDCIITWDEMSTKQLIEYDKYKDCFEGIEILENKIRLLPASEALVIMVSGIRKNWSFPVSFYFSAGNTKSNDLQTIVEANIRRVRNIGFRVRMGICDMSFTNQGLYKKWSVNEDVPFLVLDGQKVYMIHDTPHLIKLVRNNLMNRSFEYQSVHSSEVQHAHWSVLKEFYTKDSNRLARMAPKLTKLHLEVKNFSKMKVKLATQLLSHSVASGIRTMVSLEIMSESALQTAEFVECIDQMFDLLNIIQQYDKSKKFKCGVYLMNHPELLDSYKSLITSIKVSNTSRPKCFHGLVLTMCGIKSLLLDLKQEGYRYVLTRKLQQDCLENLFSVIRMKGGWSKNPTSREFRNRFKIVFLKSFIQKSKSSNCQDNDNDDDMAFNSHLLHSLFLSKLPKTSNDDEIVADKLELNVSENLSEVDLQGSVISCSSFFDEYDGDKTVSMECKNIAVYLGSYCVKKILEKYDCEHCKSLLRSLVEPERREHFLTYSKAYCKSNVRKLNTSSSKITYANVIKQEDSLVFANIMRTFVNKVNESLQISSQNVLRNVEVKYLKDEGLATWIQNSDCKSHRYFMIQLLFRVLIFRLVMDKNENWKQSKSWGQRRIDLRSQ